MNLVDSLRRWTISIPAGIAKGEQRLLLANNITKERIDELVNHYYYLLKTNIESHYENSTLATLFKNATKCKHLGELVSS